MNLGYKALMIIEHNIQKKHGIAPFFANGADYFSLLKPRVMSLVLFTAFIGLLLAPGTLGLWRSFLALLFIALGAGASGALNMWYDADIDAIMKRTKSRPIPAGKITAFSAFCFGFSLAILSVIGLGLVTNWAAAGLLAFTIFFYIVIYTIFLKRYTSQNIVIGGAAGSFPPLVGYVCVSGNVTFEAVVLFLVIFLWTPPHFWALALFTTTDYEAAKIPMLPNIKGVQVTKNNILVYSVLMAISAILPFYFSQVSFFYLIVAICLNFWFLHYAYLLWRTVDAEKTKLRSRRLFYFSLLYLALLFCSLLVEIIVRFT